MSGEHPLSAQHDRAPGRSIVSSNDLTGVNKLSAIIPCKNERRWIAVCVDALLKQRVNDLSLEVIVVDNGSTDGTIEILESYGPKIGLFILPDATISELRNFGAERAAGDWLAFIDSDVEVDDDWCAGVIRALRRMREAGYDLARLVTGSTYSIPESPKWIERVWFQQLLARDETMTSYINGGNLVVSKRFFDEIGGFAPDYYTGEDVKFCRDAVAEGGKVIKAAEIRAVHHGYPKTIFEFFRRERWHGLGMKQYLFKPWQLKDLMLALYFVCITVLFLIAVVASGYRLVTVGGWLALMVLPIFVLAFSRTGKRPQVLFPLTYLFFVYGWARVFSLVDIMLGRRAR